MRYDEHHKKTVNPIEEFEKISKLVKKVFDKFVDHNDINNNLSIIHCSKLKPFLEKYESESINEGMSKNKFVVQSTPEYIFKLKLFM